MNALESAIWIGTYRALTSLQSKPIGCDWDEALDGDSSVGAGGTPGGAGGVLPPVRVTFVTNASPQKIDGSPLKIVSKAPVVAGKFCENVMPVT